MVAPGTCAARGALVERPACPLCGTGAPDVLIQHAYGDAGLSSFLASYYGGRADAAVLGDGKYVLATCRACSFIWQVSVLDPVGMAALYSTWISAEASLARKATGAFEQRYRRECAAIRSWVCRPPQHIKVLDFGAGWGFWLRAAKAEGYDGVGIEIANDRINYAAQMGIRLIPTLSHLGDERFLFINAEQVLEHVAGPLDVFRGLADRLEDGGVLHVAVPNGFDTRRICRDGAWKPEKGPTQPLEHINTFTATTLVQMAAEVGLGYAGDAAGVRLMGRLRRRLGWTTAPRSTSLFFRKPSNAHPPTHVRGDHVQ